MGYKGRHRLPTARSRGTAAAMTTAAMTAGGMLGTVGTASAETPDWGPIIKCESGGNPTAKNRTSTASGLFQFINGTWAAYGGLEFAPTARQATVEQQYIVANRAFAREGYRPWNASKSCWAGKIGKGVAADIKPAQKPAPKKAAEKRPERAAERVSAEPRVKAPAKPVLPADAKPGPFTDGPYTVKPGDTLSGIAAANKVAGGWQSIYEKNKDVVEHADWIFPGEKLDL